MAISNSLVTPPTARPVIGPGKENEMQEFAIGDFVTIPLKTRDELGLVVEIDDCDGQYIANPWVIINTMTGSHQATLYRLHIDGVRKIPQREHKTKLCSHMTPPQLTMQ